MGLSHRQLHVAEHEHQHRNRAKTRNATIGTICVKLTTIAPVSMTPSGTATSRSKTLLPSTFETLDSVRPITDARPHIWTLFT